jgi:hypothetical protein
MTSFDTHLQAEDFYSDYYPTDQDLKDMVEDRQKAFEEVSQRIDLSRANAIRKEYGKVGWLVSWSFDQDLEMWSARLSCPKHDDTIEAIGQSICLAIDNATRALMNILSESL